ncbi:hypothetical protein A3K78_09810 [Candidatus Bathyarchaeota archaeon RBG_13_52_12]|nr:MAG: hypothetical protein A3K78_09810 [Candidatus Bathyarchaeota archaeon RBG_13_52_12]
MRDWRKVKNEIEHDLDRIFWEEPIEVEMSRFGVFPSGAEVHGQVLGNLLFLVGDTSAMGWKCAQPTVNAALRDPSFTKEQCEAIWRAATMPIAKLVGEVDPPRCPAPWLNLPKVLRFAKEVDESFPSVASKDELEDLLWSWFNYINTLNRWFTVAFPFELGALMPRRSGAYIEHLRELNDIGLSNG